MLLPISDILPLEVDRKDRSTKAYWDHETALMEDIKVNGIRTPLKVYRKGGKLQLVAGQTRLRAAIRAGLTEVLAQVLEGPITPTRLLMEEVADNNSGQPFSKQAMLDIAEEFRRLEGWPMAEVCRRVPGMAAASTMSRERKIERLLDSELKAKYDAREIEFRLAYALCNAPAEMQKRLYTEVRDLNMCVIGAEGHIRDAYDPPAKKKTKPKKVKASQPGLVAEFVDDSLEAAEARVKALLAGIQRLMKLNAPLAALPGVLKA